MPIVVQYDNDYKTVIRYEFVGNWTWGDYGQAITEAHRLTDKFPHVVDLILDFSRSDSIPGYAMTNVATSLGALSRKFRVTLIVSDSPYIDTLIKVYRRIFTSRDRGIVLVKSLAEARQILSDIEDCCA